MALSTLINPQILNSFSLSDLIFYMNYQPGWERVRSSSGWHVFVSSKDVSPTELEIILPAEYDEYTAPTYIASALNILCNIKEEDPLILAQSINRYESDLLYVRNTEVTKSDSIELDVAARQLQDLRNLIRQAADLESRKLPHDLSSHSIDANKLANQYRFGHTFRGSFGFTLEAPLMSQVEKSIQYSFGHTDAIPLSRKVMERIARGLIFVSESAKEKSSNKIVSNYLTGLNANMCASLISVSRDYQFPIEYKIIWSPVIQVELDIDDFDPVLVDTDELIYLEKAEQELKDLNEKPFVEVRGLVKRVGATDAPLGDTARRTIQVKWLNNPFSKRTTNLEIEIDAEAYQIAHSAHLDWDIILVEGIARNTPTGWVLDEPKNFRLESDED